VRNAYKIVVGKPGNKTPLGELRVAVRTIMLGDTDVTVTGWEGVKWVNVAKDSDQWRDVVYTMMDHRVV
jgi:hypothetical protein